MPSESKIQASTVMNYVDSAVYVIFCL